MQLWCNFVFLLLYLKIGKNPCKYAIFGALEQAKIRFILKSMLDDGRLAWACGGTMVDVRSIAEYICEPRAQEEKARKQRVARKYSSNWAV